MPLVRNRGTFEPQGSGVLSDVRNLKGWQDPDLAMFL